MPLIFLRHSDLDVSNKLFVRKSFFDGGFVNMAVMDVSSEIIKRLCCEHKLDGKKYALTVFASGSNLYVDAIDVKQKTLLRTLTLQGKGADPRIDYAVELMWQSLGYQSYSLVRENENEILRRVAATFLQSVKIEFNDLVVFSDGVERMVYLSRNQLEGMSVGIDVAIRGSIQNFMSQLKIAEQDCAIIACGAVSTNDYFLANLRNVGPEVISDNDDGGQKTLSSILNAAIAADFQFGTSASSAPASLPLDNMVKSKVNRALRETALMAPQNAQVELMKIEQELMAITPAPTDLEEYLSKVKQAKKRLRQVDASQLSGASTLKMNTPKPTVKEPLPQSDVRRVENILRIASRIIPDNAIHQLQLEKDRLLQKVHTIFMSGLRRSTSRWLRQKTDTVRKSSNGNSNIHPLLCQAWEGLQRLYVQQLHPQVNVLMVQSKKPNFLLLRRETCLWLLSPTHTNYRSLWLSRNCKTFLRNFMLLTYIISMCR